MMKTVHRLKWDSLPPNDVVARKEKGKIEGKDRKDLITFCPGNHGLLPKKSFKPVCRCYHLPSGFLVIGHLPRVSRQSRLSANDKGNNKVLNKAWVNNENKPNEQNL